MDWLEKAGHHTTLNISRARGPEHLALSRRGAVEKPRGMCSAAPEGAQKQRLMTGGLEKSETFEIYDFLAREGSVALVRGLSIYSRAGLRRGIPQPDGPQISHPYPFRARVSQVSA